jgi:hypothetical protein
MQLEISTNRTPTRPIARIALTQRANLGDGLRDIGSIEQVEDIESEVKLARTIPNLKVPWVMIQKGYQYKVNAAGATAWLWYCWAKDRLPGERGDA